MFSAFPNQEGYSVCPSKIKCVCFGKLANREFVQIRECEKGDRVLVLRGGNEGGDGELIQGGISKSRKYH